MIAHPTFIIALIAAAIGASDGYALASRLIADEGTARLLARVQDAEIKPRARWLRNKPRSNNA